MKKEQFLHHFSKIPKNQKIAVSPIPYKHEGSTYDCDGIRLTGSQEFIDSVLSRITDMLEYENGQTRLQVVYKESVDRATQQPLDSYNCYLQVHYRGNEARHFNTLFGQ